MNYSKILKNNKILIFKINEFYWELGQIPNPLLLI